jgi:DNA-binding MarR family transcriptional regulator
MPCSPGHTSFICIYEISIRKITGQTWSSATHSNSLCCRPSVPADRRLSFPYVYALVAESVLQRFVERRLSRILFLSVIILVREIISRQDKMNQLKCAVKLPKPASSRKRNALIIRVGMELGRELSTTSIFFHQSIAAKLSINVTDTRCFELMSRYSQGPLTAGDLARATGLTTGAVTGILDRLEKAGLVERYRNAIDRRKVFVRPRLEALRRIGRLYEGLATASLKHASSYSTKELELIKDYLEGSLQVLRDQSAKLTR